MGCWVLLYLTESNTVQVDDVHVVSIVYAWLYNVVMVSVYSIAVVP